MCADAREGLLFDRHGHRAIPTARPKTPTAATCPAECKRPEWQSVLAGDLRGFGKSFGDG